jgi:hypothetical protein
MYSPKSSKTNRSWTVYGRTEAMSSMRCIYYVGWILVSLLWLSIEDKTKKQEVQIKIKRQHFRETVKKEIPFKILG